MLTALAQWLIRLLVSAGFTSLERYLKDARRDEDLVQKGRLEQSVTHSEVGAKIDKAVQDVADVPVTEDEFDKRAEEGTL